MKTKKQKSAGKGAPLELVAEIVDSPMLRNGDRINLSIHFDSRVLMVACSQTERMQDFSSIGNRIAEVLKAAYANFRTEKYSRISDEGDSRSLLQRKKERRRKKKELTAPSLCLPEALFRPVPLRSEPPFRP